MTTGADAGTVVILCRRVMRNASPHQPGLTFTARRRGGAPPGSPSFYATAATARIAASTSASSTVRLVPSRRYSVA